MNGRLARFVSRLAPSCRAVMRLVSRSFDQSLGRADRLTVSIHMLHCSACRRSRRQIAILVALLRRSAKREADGPIPGLSEEVRERIKRKLRQE